MRERDLANCAAVMVQARHAAQRLQSAVCSKITTHTRSMSVHVPCSLLSSPSFSP